MHIGHRWSSTLIGFGEGVCSDTGHLCLCPLCLTSSVLAVPRTYFSLISRCTGLDSSTFWRGGRVNEQGCLSQGIWKTLLWAEEGAEAWISRQWYVQRAGNGVWFLAAHGDLRWGGLAENLSSEGVSKGLIIWATWGPPAGVQVSF